MPSFAFFQGETVPLEEAKIGVMAHALHYGTAVFEGIRGNWNEEAGQLYLFRLPEHYRRLLKGASILKMKPAYKAEDLCNITVELARKCQLKEDIYVRPLAYKSSQAFGVRLHNLEDDLLVIIIPWGAYLDVESAHCGVSSWHRPPDNTMPPSVKISGMYVNNAFAKTQAIENGFDEAIMLTPDGHVAEGSGENIFILAGGKLVTPPTSDNILPGITRDSIITLAREELGIETIERTIDRVELYNAEECFLTGTAAHLTPVSEVDHYKIGSCPVGPFTKKLMGLYFDVIRGKHPGYMHWCTPVFPE
ncbi:MAG: branched-chain amino acid transaminase [Dehalococcoidales bacterium]|jgi:branched-chain amino acid aminotransferase|nr:branched-chain amino acid transaminase [Dehalococcoidales bacterium]MDD5122123.1 branched-chain amino acid transaminase [Dehalococcoidales bacterium]MDD5499049.1 branched-chain amino acid transaminase [Dehalococcoidales bacterium]MDX9803822.1 branched-chain amino acid transaminase [Dehalococcoidales bacterium]